MSSNEAAENETLGIGNWLYDAEVNMKIPSELIFHESFKVGRCSVLNIMKTRLHTCTLLLIPQSLLLLEKLTLQF